MIKDIAIEKMKSASNYVITFLKWALISIIIGVVGGCVGALFHMSVNYANIIFTMHDWFVLFLPIGGIIIVAMYKACKMLENKGTDSIISSIRNDEKVPILLAPLTTGNDTGTQQTPRLLSGRNNGHSRYADRCAQPARPPGR